MRPRCLLTDLDRTLTGTDLVLDPAALPRIEALRRAGVLVVIATGRRLEDVVEMGLHDAVDGLVAENGAILCLPAEQRMETRHADFGDVARRALGDLSGAFRWARVLGSGPRGLAPEATRRLQAAGVRHGLEYNAEEVMLLPAGVDKASGVARCLSWLGVEPEACWAIGDGENDACMLRLAGVGAAPANAAPAAWDAADVHLASTYSRAFLDLTAPLVETRASPTTAAP